MNPIEFLEALLRSREYVTEWERLRGVRLRLTPIEQAIDRATGNPTICGLGMYEAAAIKLFVHDAVDLWLRTLRPKGQEAKA